MHKTPKLKYSSFLIIGLIFLSSFVLVQKNETSTDLKLITDTTSFEAGNAITLKFSSSKIIEPYLYCSNSYGSLLIKPTLKNNFLYYLLPKTMSNKKGIVHWKINNTSVFGKLNITPIQKVNTMETYIGPPSIEAGGRDFSMLVVIPTDSLDNPLAENTAVTVNNQFLQKQKKDIITIKNLMAYKNYYSPLKDGRMLLSSECLQKNSKEYTVIVYPSNPTNFTISVERHHEYADGNQITSFYSSIIKDIENNVVSDGTFVTFFIKNEKGAILKTSGTTIKGIVSAKIIHPDYKTTWSVKAYVEGMAESNTLTVTYKKVLKDFNIAFSENNRSITVGPLQSFMQQMIPDGLEVTLLVYKNNQLINTEIKTSYNGFVNFSLNTAVYPKENYDLKISTAGLEKDFKQIHIW